MSGTPTKDSPQSSMSGSSTDLWGRSSSSSDSSNLGHDVVDPTKNVMDMVAAAILRVDDLRQADATLTTAKLEHQREVIDLHARHAREIRELEKSSQSAARQVDILNQDRAVERQQAAILTLERTTQSNKEALSELVDRTAKALAQKTASDLIGLETRIAELERKSYLGAGKDAISDPRLEKFISLVESLQQTRSTITGSGTGLSLGWKMLVGGLGLILILLELIRYLPKG